MADIIQRYKTYLKILAHDLLPGGFSPIENRRYFSQQVTFINIKREKIFASAILLLHIPLLYIDMINKRENLWSAMPGYRHLFYLHVIMLSGMALFFLLIKFRRIFSPNDIGPWHKSLSILFAVYCLMCCSLISIVDQSINQQISVYIIGFFVIASVFYIQTWMSIPVYLIPYLILMVGLYQTQKDPHILKTHFINASIVLVLSWVISRIFYVGFLRDFANRDLIEKQREILTRQSKEDFLTGIYNRRYLELLLSQEFARATRYNLRLSVAMADIDFFKKINDTYSHGTGDKVLKTVSILFRDNIRSFDIIGRYGGEEFVLILPGTDIQEASVVCERIRQSIENYNWGKVYPGLKVTISLGISDKTEIGNYEKLLSLADKKLYEAKENGRNQVRY